MDLLNQILKTKETFRIPNFNEIVRGANDWMERLDRFVDDFSFDDLNEQFDHLKEEMDNSLGKLREKISQLQINEVFVINYNRDTDTLSTRMEDGAFVAEVQSLDGNTTSIHTFSSPKLEGFCGTPKREYDAVNHKMKFIFGEGEETQEEVKEETQEEAKEEAQEEAKEEAQPAGEPIDERIATAVKLHNEGWSFRKIASVVGVSDKTVARWIRKNG